MKRYETIVIIDPDLAEEGRGALLEKTEGLISAQNGLLVEFDDWGNRKLAYEIKKKPRGHYVRADFCGDGDLVDELERNFRIDDRVMKYMTVLLDEDVDMDRVKEEIAQKATPPEEASEQADASEPAQEPAAAEKAEPVAAESAAAEATTETESKKEE